LKKQRIALTLALAFLMASLTGCAGIRNGSRMSATEPRAAQDTLSARHLAGLIGLSDEDVHRTLGTASRDGIATEGTGREHRTLYGKQSNFDVRYGDDDRVRQVTVTVDKADALRWRQELNALYGTHTASTEGRYHWQDALTRIDMTEQGDAVHITITGTAL